MHACYACGCIYACTICTYACVHVTAWRFSPKVFYCVGVRSDEEPRHSRHHRRSDEEPRHSRHHRRDAARVPPPSLRPTATLSFCCTSCKLAHGLWSHIRMHILSSFFCMTYMSTSSWHTNSGRTFACTCISHFLHNICMIAP